MGHQAHPGGSSRRSEEPPLVEGGQGRIPQEIVDDAVGAMQVVVYALAALCGAAVFGLVWWGFLR